MNALRYAIVFIAVLLFSAFCLHTCPAQGAERIVAEEKMELWRHVDVVNGHTIVCYYPRNPKLLSNKVTTGVSCVLVEPVVVYHCNPRNHEHPQYQLRDNGQGLW